MRGWGGGGGWLGKSLKALQLNKEGKRRAKFGRDSRADRQMKEKRQR